MPSRKGFDYNDEHSTPPWGAKESQCWEDTIDTLVTDTVSSQKDVAGHKHFRIYDSSGNTQIDTSTNNIINLNSDTSVAGNMTIGNLAGSGDRWVVADTTGGLSAPAKPNTLAGYGITDGNAAHIILGSEHSDTWGTSIATGALMAGITAGDQTKWGKLVIGAANKVLISDGTNPLWNTPSHGVSTGYVGYANDSSTWANSPLTVSGGNLIVNSGSALANIKIVTDKSGSVNVDVRTYNGFSWRPGTATDNYSVTLTNPVEGQIFFAHDYDDSIYVLSIEGIAFGAPGCGLFRHGLLQYDNSAWCMIGYQ